MERLKYFTEETIEVDDIVIIKRRILRDISGVVVYVYNPDNPSPPKGNNDYGFTVQISETKYRFYGYSPKSDPKVILVKRKIERK